MFIGNKKILILLLYLLVDYIFSSSWPNVRFNLARTGAKCEVAVPSVQPYGWSFQIQGEILSSPIVKDDLVYFGGRDCSIWSLDAYSGEVVWQFSTSGRIDGSPVVWKDYLYVFSYDGKLYCFKRICSPDEYFIPLWTYDTQHRGVCPPVIVEDDQITNTDVWIIFVTGPKFDGTPQGKLYILNAITGNVIEVKSLGSFSYSSICYHDRKILFTTNDGTLQCYDLLKQNFKWQKKFNCSFHYSNVAVKDNKVYLYAGDIERRVYILDLNTSEILWMSEQLSNIATDNNSISVYEDKILVNLYPTSTWSPRQDVRYSSQTVVCISTAVGVVWRRDFFVKTSPRDSYGWSSAVSVAGNTAFFGTYNGDFVAVDINTGQTIVNYNFPSPIVCSPAIANGWVYFAETRGVFYGVKLEKFLAIKQPDFKDIVINSTTIKIVSDGFTNREFDIEYSKMDEWIKITSGVITSGELQYFWDTRSLIDGEYSIRIKIDTTSYAEHAIVIDNSPLPPTNVTCVVQDFTKILLTWTKSLDDGDGNNDVVKYNIYRSTDGLNFNYVTSVVKGTVSYIDTPQPGSTYYYKLTAVDKHSESVSSAVKYVYLPTIFESSVLEVLLEQITSYNAIAVCIKWTFRGDIQSVAGYRIYKSSDGYNFFLLKQLDADTSFYVDYNCESGRKYYYRVSAFDVNGVMIVSTEKSLQTEYKVVIRSGEEVELIYTISDMKLQLTFPENALDKDISLSIIVEDNKEFVKNITPIIVYRFLSDNVRLKSPVKMRIYYNPSKLPVGINENLLRVFYYDSKLEKWLLVNSSKVYPEHNYVEADIYHFSCYALAAVNIDPDKIFKDEEVYAVPSPARGDKVYFKFKLYQPAEVTVYVYDVNGDFVWKSETKHYTDKDIGIAHTIEWNIKKVPTDIYVFVLKGRSRNKQQNVIKKFAVIH